jgi:hypothetical protein
LRNNEGTSARGRTWYYNGGGKKTTTTNLPTKISRTAYHHACYFLLPRQSPMVNLCDFLLLLLLLNESEGGFVPTTTTMKNNSNNNNNNNITIVFLLVQQNYHNNNKNLYSSPCSTTIIIARQSKSIPYFSRAVWQYSIIMYSVVVKPFDINAVGLDLALWSNFASSSKVGNSVVASITPELIYWHLQK